MTEYRKIRDALSPTFERFGLHELEENLEPDVYGSAFSVFSNKTLKYRIVWDGKDGCGFIEHEKKGSVWEKLNVSAPEGTQNAFDSALLRMRISLAEHIALQKINA